MARHRMWLIPAAPSSRRAGAIATALLFAVGAGCVAGCADQYPPLEPDHILRSVNERLRDYGATGERSQAVSRVLLGGRQRVGCSEVKLDSTVFDRVTEPEAITITPPEEFAREYGAREREEVVAQARVIHYVRCAVPIIISLDPPISIPLDPDEPATYELDSIRAVYSFRLNDFGEWEM